MNFKKLSLMIPFAMTLVCAFAQNNPVENKSTRQPDCIRWKWSGDVYNRTVVCIEWRKAVKEEVKK
jgi:hypothetical protein